MPADHDHTRRATESRTAHHRRPVRTDDLRLAAALVHAVPGAAIELTTVDGRAAVVAHHRLDATMTPCQLRALVAASYRDASGPVLDHIVSLRLVSGVEHLGGGIHRRSGGSMTGPSIPGSSIEERWIVTTIAHERVLDVLSACPIETPDDVVRARVIVDGELDTVAVCFGAEHGLWAWRLDEVAYWVQAACLVAELTGA